MNPGSKLMVRSNAMFTRAHFPAIWRGAIWTKLSVRPDGVRVDLRKPIGIPVNLFDRVSKAASVRFLE